MYKDKNLKIKRYILIFFLILIHLLTTNSYSPNQICIIFDLKINSNFKLERLLKKREIERIVFLTSFWYFLFKVYLKMLIN